MKGRRRLRARWRVQAPRNAALAQAEFISAEQVRSLWGSLRSLLRGACGGPAPEAVKVQIENMKKFVQEREA